MSVGRVLAHLALEPTVGPQEEEEENARRELSGLSLGNRLSPREEERRGSTIDGGEVDIHQVSKGPSFGGVAKYFGEHHGMQEVNPDSTDETGNPSRWLQRSRGHSGEVDPDGWIQAPGGPKPFRWEPEGFVDDAQAAPVAAAGRKAGVLKESNGSDWSPGASAKKAPGVASQGSGSYAGGASQLVAVLQEQLRAERARTAQTEARLEESQRSAREAADRASRAEAKFEMQSAIIAKLEAARAA